MRTFRIYRPHWQRGNFTEKIGESELYHSGTETKCCLGFIAQQCGVKKEKLDGVGMPSEISVGYHETNKTLKVVQENEDDFTRINDDGKISDDVREKRLKKLARKLGFRMVFTGPKGYVRVRV